MKVEEIRKFRGWTRMELARRAGVSYSLLFNIERKGRKPKPRSAKKIADALGVGVDIF